MKSFALILSIIVLVSAANVNQIQIKVADDDDAGMNHLFGQVGLTVSQFFTLKYIT